MFNLHILDVSALLHYGMNSVRYKDKVSYGFPVGGIHRVMRQIATAIANRDSFILAFDSKTNFRKRYMPEYKAGRISNKEVVAQAELLWEYLNKVGLACYKFDNYEGDDIVNWICTDKEITSYDYVYIYANDKDLIHNVRKNIIFVDIRDDSNIVTENNFPFAIEPDVRIPFNFVNVRKVLTGCPSDKVPAFKSESGLTGSDIFNWYLKTLENNKIPFIYENTTSTKLFMKCLSAIPVFTEKDIAELEKRIKVIFPAEKPEDFVFRATSHNKYDKEAFARFLTLVNDYDTIKSLGLRRTDLTDMERDILRTKSKALVNGAFAVDRNMVVNDFIDPNILNLKEF